MIVVRISIQWAILFDWILYAIVADGVPAVVLFLFFFFLCQLITTVSGFDFDLVGCSAPNSNTSIDCNGHGKCETKENGQSCLCYYGFTGPYCEHSKSSFFPIIIMIILSQHLRLHWKLSTTYDLWMNFIRLRFFSRFEWLFTESMQK